MITSHKKESRLTSYEEESRRKLAITLFARGKSREFIAVELGVHYATVRRWILLWREGGLEALNAKRGGRPARLISDDNPLTDAYGEEYDVDTDPRFATNRHPVEDIEPLPPSDLEAKSCKMRSCSAWLVGKRWDPEAIARRVYAGALVISGTVFEDTRIEIIARKTNTTKQALSKNMSEFIDLLGLDDAPQVLLNRRSAKARKNMKTAARKSHARRKQIGTYLPMLSTPCGFYL